MKYTKIALIPVICCLTLISKTALSEECQDKDLVKSGTIHGISKSVGLLLGYRWAEGTITLNNGQKYKFKAKGGKVAEIGYSETEVSGTIYNLEKIQDFAGVYSGIGAGMTILKGVGGASFTNPRCVAINVKRIDATGLQSSLPAPGIVNIELVK